MDVVGHGVSSKSYSAVSPYGNFTARTGIGPEIINYIAIASLPPNSVMPSASFGSAETTIPYGEYDNGANVFNDYWNFEGTSTPSVFTVINPSGVTVNNGIYIAPQPNNYAGIQYNGVFSPNSVVEYDELNSYSINGCWAIGEAVGSFNSSGGYIYVYNQGGSAPSPMGWSGGSIVISNGIAYNSIFNSVPRNDIIIGEAWPKENLQVYYAGNQVADESSTSQTLINSGISFSFGGYYCTSGSSISAALIRVRTYPPNGVMPSVTFG